MAAKAFITHYFIIAAVISIISVITVDTTTTISPDNTPSASPENTTTVSPDNTPSASPENTTTVSPDNTTTESPDNTPTASPDNTTTVSPDNTPTVTPNNTPTVSPDNTPTVSPDNTTKLSPDNTTTVYPDNTTTVSPDNTTTVSPDNTTTVSPDNTPTVSPDNTTTVSPDNTPTVSPENTTTVSQDNTPTISPDNTPTVSPNNTPTVTPDNTPTVSPDNTTTVSPDNTTTVSPDNTTTLSPDNTTTVSPDNTTTVSPDNTTTVSPDNTPTVSPDNTPSASPDNTTTVSPDNTTTVSPDNTTTVSPDNTTTVSPDNTPTVSPDNTTTVSPDNTTTVSPENTQTVSPDNTPTVSPDNTPTVSPDNTSTVSPDNTPTVSPDNTPTVSPDNTPTVSPDNTSTVSPDNTTKLSPDNTPTVSPENTPTVSPDYTTTVSPDNTTTTLSIDSTAFPDTTATEFPDNTTAFPDETTATEFPDNKTAFPDETTATEFPDNSTAFPDETTATEFPDNTTSFPDETTATEFPDKTTSFPDETTTTEFPDNTTAFPDETTATELPDNTTEFLDTTATEFPDNTTEFPDTTTTAFPDETTTTEFPDEITATEFPDETTATEFPDETTETEFPDETTATEFPDETTATEFPDETTATEFPDETTETEFPDETTATEFPDETTATEFPDETTATEFPDETTATEFPDETTATEFPDETTATEFPDTTATEFPDETTATEFQDETTATEFPDNTTAFPDETTVTEFPDNTTAFPDETTATKFPDNTTEFSDTTATEFPDNTTEFFPDETTATEFPDDTTTTAFLDDTTTTEFPDETTATEFPDETTATEFPDNTTAFPDETTATEFPDNTTPFPDETTATEFPDNTTEFPDTTATEFPDNTTEFPDTTATEFPDDTTTTEFPDETTATEIPDETTTTEFPDETTATEFPDETTATEFPDETTTEFPDKTTTTEFPDNATAFPDTSGTEFPDITGTEFPDTTTTEAAVLDTTENFPGSVRCLETVDSRGSTWYTTLAGDTRTQECGIGYTGVKTRRCSLVGTWELPIYECLKTSIQALYMDALTLDSSATEDDIANVLSQGLEESISDGDVLTEGDIVALVDILNEVSRLLSAMTSISNSEMVQRFTDVASSVIDPANSESWESLSTQGVSAGETVLGAMDALVEVVGESLDNLVTIESGSFHVTSDNLDFKVEKTVGETIVYPNPNDTITGWVLESGSSLQFDVSSLPEKDIQYTVASMIYKDLSSILPTSTSVQQQELNGQIMSFSTFPSITGTLSVPINIKFDQSTDLLTKPSCSYWKFNDGGIGTWATDGCTVTETSVSYTICSCNHLTNFGLVLSLQDCGVPNVPTNGNVFFDKTTYTSVAEYICEPGYILTGSQYTECSYDGSWSQAAAACTAIEEENKVCSMNTDSRGFVWLETPAGETRVKLCQTGYTGNMFRLCKSDGTWQWPQNKCIRVTVQEIEEQVADVNINTTENDISQTVAEIKNITEVSQTEGTMEEKLTDGEIIVLSTSLEKVGSVVQYDTDFVNDDVVNDFVESASNLIDDANRDSWQALIESDTPGAESLLTAVTSLVEAVGQTLNETETKTVVKKNLAVEAQKYTNTDVVFPEQIVTDEFEWVKETKSRIQLEKESLQDKSYVITMVMYKDISRILPSNTDKNKTTSQDTNDFDYKINGPILAMTISPKENAPSVFDPPITITFEHNEDNLTSPECSFWKFKNGGLGAWSSTGCWVNSTNETITVCQCDHLTNFAVLMSPFNEVDSTSMALRIISIVGIGISICCILITFFVHFCFWRLLRNDRTTILMNLCVSLLFAYIVFLAGIDRTESKVACAIIAGFLQYLYLVVFCVMLVEGIQIAITVLYVFKTTSRIKRLLVAAWILPGIIVAISAGVTQGDGYGSDSFCWLSVDNGLIWAFVGPALVIILCNAICIILVVRAMCGTSAMKMKKTQEKVRASLRSLCVLVPVMGISWLLGIFYVNDDFFFVQFIFAILNGLQGLFIFIFHCLLNSQVRNVLALRSRRKLSAQDMLKSSSKSSPGKNSKPIYSKDSSSYVEESGDNSKSSDNQLLGDWTNHILQPQLKLNGAKFASPLTANGIKNLRPASTFSSRSRAQLSSEAFSSSYNNSGNGDQSWNRDIHS